MNQKSSGIGGPKGAVSRAEQAHNPHVNPDGSCPAHGDNLRGVPRSTPDTPHEAVVRNQRKRYTLHHAITGPTSKRVCVPPDNP